MKNIFAFLFFLFLLSGCEKKKTADSAKAGFSGSVFSGKLVPDVSDPVYSSIYSIIRELTEEGTFLRTGEIIACMSTEELSVTLKNSIHDIEVFKLQREMEILDNSLKLQQSQDSMQISSMEVKLRKLELSELVPDEKEIIPLKMELDYIAKLISEQEERLSDLKKFQKSGFVSATEIRSAEKSLAEEKIKLEKKQLELELKQKSPELEIARKKAQLLDAENTYSLNQVKLDALLTEMDVDTKKYETELLQKTADYEKTLNDISSAVITSPSSGYLVYKETWSGGGREKARLGSSLWDGLEFASVENPFSYHMELDLPQSYLSTVNEGTPLCFSPVSDPASCFKGKISSINKVVTFDREDHKTVRRVKMKAQISISQDFLPGMTVSGFIGRDTFPGKYFTDFSFYPMQETKVVKKDFISKIEGIAEFFSNRSINIPARFSGKIKMMAAEGSEIHTGEVIAELTSDDLDKNLKSRERELNQLSSEAVLLGSELENLKKNISDNLVSLEDKMKIAGTEYQLSLSSSPDTMKKLELRNKNLSSQKDLLELKLKNSEELLKKGFTSYSDHLSLMNQILSCNIQLELLRLDISRKKEGDEPVTKFRKEIEAVESRTKYERQLSENEIRLRSFELKKKLNGIKLQYASDKVSEAMKSITDLTYHAPLSGYVLHLKHYTNSGLEKFKEGDEIRTFNNFLAVTDVSDLALKGYLQEQYLRKVRQGQKVVFSFSKNPERKFSGEIYRIVPYIQDSIAAGDNSSRYFQLIIRLHESSPSFQPELMVNFEILQNVISQAMVLPAEAVFADSEGFYILKSGKKKKRVEVLDYNQHEFAIKNLSEHETVLMLKRGSDE